MYFFIDLFILSNLDLLPFMTQLQRSIITASTEENSIPNEMKHEPPTALLAALHTSESVFFNLCHNVHFYLISKQPSPFYFPLKTTYQKDFTSLLSCNDESLVSIEDMKCFPFGSTINGVIGKMSTTSCSTTYRSVHFLLHPFHSRILQLLHCSSSDHSWNHILQWLGSI